MNTLDDRVLVLAPTGRDAGLASEVLARSGIACVVCASCADLLREMGRGVAAVLVAEEALGHGGRDALVAALRAQPTWSDLPVLLIAHAATPERRSLGEPEELADLGNVTVLERPLRTVVLVSAVASAVRARRRQYEVRDLLSTLERGVRDRDAFIATLSHELRNPLGAIRNALELIDRARPPAEARSPERDVLRRQTRHMTRLVDDLLDVSRVTTGKIALQKQRVDLAETVRRGLEAFAIGDGRSARHRVSFRCEEGAVFLVDGDPVRLEQILSNLLTNALKYTPSGGRIDVSLVAAEGSAVLTLEDDGVGVALDVLPRIFDLFTQAERSLDRADGGLGIGLTLVRALVELHGGTVELLSEGVGRGTTVRVRLPLAALVTADGSRRSDRPAPERASSVRAQRVLLVEDNDDVRETLSMLLEHLGYGVTVASDGPTAVAAAESARPDAAIVDIGLPGFDGYEVARRLRPSLPSTMLVALTGYGQPDDRRRSAEAGFHAHLTKPVDIDELDALLARGAG